MKTSIVLTLVLLLMTSSFGCANRNRVGHDEKDTQGLRAKTFYDAADNVEVMVASQGNASIVAVPRTAISRRNAMGDDELSCLAKCAKIEDLEARLNCILACPVTKQWQVTVLRDDKVQKSVTFDPNIKVFSPQPEGGTSSRTFQCTKKAADGSCLQNECKQGPGGETFDCASFAALCVDAGEHWSGTKEGGKRTKVI